MAQLNLTRAAARLSIGLVAMQFLNKAFEIGAHFYRVNGDGIGAHPEACKFRWPVPKFQVVSPRRPVIL